MAYLSLPLHHAYLLSGKREEVHRKLIAVLREECGIISQGNPYFSYQALETLSIDDARALMESQTRSAVGARRIYILSFFFATHEAQNALLKMLEEPASSTSFFIIIPSPKVLLPTVLSRLSRLNLGYEAAAEEDTRAFLESSVSERLTKIEKMARSDNESKKSDLLSLMIGIEELCAWRFRDDIPREWVEPLRELLELKKYIFDRAPSVKMLGEYIAVRLPRLESGK